jgi:hypothetical protein
VRSEALAPTKWYHLHGQSVACQFWHKVVWREKLLPFRPLKTEISHLGLFHLPQSMPPTRAPLLFPKSQDNQQGVLHPLPGPGNCACCEASAALLPGGSSAYRPDTRFRSLPFTWGMPVWLFRMRCVGQASIQGIQDWRGILHGLRGRRQRKGKPRSVQSPPLPPRLHCPLEASPSLSLAPLISPMLHPLKNPSRRQMR